MTKCIVAILREPKSADLTNAPCSVHMCQMHNASSCGFVVDLDSARFSTFVCATRPP